MKANQVKERYLVINDEGTQYFETATEAAIALGKPKWDTAETCRLLWKLQPGDELYFDSHQSVIFLSGVEYDKE